MQHMFRLFCAGALLVAACSTPDDATENWGDASTVAQSMRVGPVLTPTLEVGPVVIGQPVEFTATGLSPGQNMAIFEGDPNDSASCGTAIPRRYQAAFGTQCLTPFNAHPIIRGLTADANGVVHATKFLNGLALGDTLQFQAVTPARTRTVHSNAVTQTVVKVGLDCVRLSSPVDQTVVSGGWANPGDWSCTAQHGDVHITGADAIHHGSIDFYQDVELFADGVQVDAQVVDGSGGLSYHFDYLVADGDTVVFSTRALVTNLVPSGSISQLELTSVYAESSASADDASWSGQSLGPIVTLASTGTLQCAPSPLFPLDYLVVANSQDALAFIRCYATGEDVTILSTDVDIDGDERMYDAYTVRTSTTPARTGFSSNGHLRVNGSSILVQDGGYVDLSLVGHAAQHVGHGGTAYSGDMSTPTFTQIDAIGMSSGEHTVWVGSIRGATTTLYATIPNLTLGAYSPVHGTPGVGNVFTFNVYASPTNDLDIEMLEFHFETTDGSNSGWNVCDTNSLASYNMDHSDFSLTDTFTRTALDADADWTLYAGSGACNTSPQVMTDAVLDLGNNAPIVEAGFTRTYSLTMDSTGVSPASDDHVIVSITDMCWFDGFVHVCSNMVPGLPLRSNVVMFN